MSQLSKNLLIVVAKAPASGQTKTRLGGLIGLDAAAAFYRCLLQDTLAAARCVPDIDRAIAYLPLGVEAFFNEIAPDFALMLQKGATLSERLNNAVNEALAQGYSAVAVMSSDIPLVKPDYITQAFAALANGADVAMGASDDGGYYILVLKSSQPNLFLPIIMSTPTVVAETLAAAAAANLHVHHVPNVADVDVPDDLIKLQDELMRLPASVAAHSRQWLKQHPH